MFENHVVTETTVQLPFLVEFSSAHCFQDICIFFQFLKNWEFVPDTYSNIPDLEICFF